MTSATESDKYEVLEKIGHGSFGIIRKVRRRSDGLIMCRKEISYIKMSTKEREQLHAEFSILNSLQHPNIVGYYHREHVKASQDLFLYMEYCGGGDLSKVIQKLKVNNQYADEEFVWSIFTQLVTALYRCHYGVDPPEVGKNVIGAANVVKPAGLRAKNQVMILHRDLKPENVFLGEDNSVKLGDFGLSKLLQSHDFASTYVGTPFYMSPEICAAERYTSHSDIWSLGCIMYELCTRSPPFLAKTHFHLVQKIKEGRIDPLPKHYSPELHAVIKSCLKTNPYDRPDTANLLNLPVVRLIRKEKEVVEIGNSLRIKEEQTNAKLREVEQRAAGVQSEQEKLRASVESTVRREWEVKARLEIDRQVQVEIAKEMAKLQQRFELEVQAQVETEVQRRLQLQQQHPPKEQGPTSAPDINFSSISTNGESDFPSSTDLSSLSIDSPPQIKSNPTPPKKTSRTPFSRARTQIDSPADVQMGQPTPMSIDCLSLSPRRNATAAAKAIPNSKNIFAAAAAQKSRLAYQLSSPNSPSTAPHDSVTDDEDDDLPDLASPTRLPVSQDPFKQPGRPGLLRQKTAPNRRLTTQTPLFPAQRPNARAPRIPSPPLATATGSPVRRAPPRPTTGSDEPMIKTMLQKNLLGNGGGRTLVELAQARAGGVSAAAKLEEGAGKMSKENEIPIWDPERDDMPSPFLSRVGKGVRGLL